MLQVLESTGFRTQLLLHVRRALLVLCSAAILWGQPASAQQKLENPAPNSFQSGISTLSGWVCNAQKVYVLIDDKIRVDVLYGSGRGDTQGVCGDTNNGFSALVNWSLLPEGVHTAALCIDDACQPNTPFVVNSYGTSFLRGVNTAVAVCTNKLSTPFVTPTVLVWQESLQNWSIGLTPSCGQVATDCSPVPTAEPGRGVCTTLLDCCR